MAGAVVLPPPTHPSCFRLICSQRSTCYDSSRHVWMPQLYLENMQQNGKARGRIPERAHPAGRRLLQTHLQPELCPADSGSRKHEIGSRWGLQSLCLPPAPLGNATLVGRLGARSPGPPQGWATSREANPEGTWGLIHSGSENIQPLNKPKEGCSPLPSGTGRQLDSARFDPSSAA